MSTHQRIILLLAAAAVVAPVLRGAAAPAQNLPPAATPRWGIATGTPKGLLPAPLQRNLMQGEQNREAVRSATSSGGILEQIRGKVEALRKRFTEQRQKTITNFFARMVERLKAALEREQKLGERIQSRIDKARANGKDVTAAQAALASARTAWEEAEQSVESAETAMKDVLSSDNPKTAFEGVKTLVANAAGKIKAVHAAFVDVVNTLKGIGGGGRPAPTATSTL